MARIYRVLPDHSSSAPELKSPRLVFDDLSSAHPQLNFQIGCTGRRVCEPPANADTGSGRAGGHEASADTDAASVGVGWWPERAWVRTRTKRARGKMRRAGMRRALTRRRGSDEAGKRASVYADEASVDEAGVDEMGADVDEAGLGWQSI
ncbi:hypothetical protein DFH09DRAFT_1269731 [Mycena vulgaris]|nr:hypothetical protein DFH09DRAFT_1269731 [Mycena vulgaris]